MSLDRNNSSNKIGQLSSIDLLIATLVFVMMITFILNFWTVNMWNISGLRSQVVMEASAISITDLFIKTAGVPDEWNSTNVEQVGLATSQNVLSSSKLANFTNMTYEAAKEVIGTDYEFNFYVEDGAGNVLYRIGNPEVGDQAAAVTRYATLNGQKVKMRMIIHD